MIGYELLRNSKKYIFRAVVILAVFVLMGMIYSGIGEERLGAFVQLVNARMPVLQKFVSLQTFLCQGENFLRLIMVVIELVLACLLMKDVTECFETDHMMGKIYYICPTLLSREKYFLQKLCGTGCSFCINITIYYIGVWAGTRVIGQSASWTNISGELLRVFFVMLMLSAIMVLWETVRQRATESSFATYLLIGTLILGNVHRLLSVLICGMRMAGKSASALFQIRRTLAAGYFISPLSWIDPFHRYESEDIVWILICCVLVSATCIGVAFWYFRKKEFS